jgi:hypothetical protein
VISTATPFDARPEFATLLGRIIERWNAVEYELALSLGHLLDGNFRAAKAIIYSLNATTVRIQLVEAVASELMPEGPELDGFLYLLNNLRNLARERNEYVHGEFWHAYHDGLDLVIIRPATKQRTTVTRVTENRLQAHIDNVEYRTDQLGLINAENPEWHVGVILQRPARRPR